MRWVASHTSLVLFLVVVLHAIMQTLHLQYPANRFFALWAGVMPLDIVKTCKAIGGELIPPLGLVVGLAFAASSVSCAHAHVVDPPAVAAAKAVERADSLAAVNCVEATAIVDKFKGRGWLALGWDELRDCWEQFGRAFRDAIELKQAEDAAADVVMMVTVPVGDAGKGDAP